MATSDRIYADQWLPVFTRVFLPRIQIASKEMEVPGPINPYRSQLILLQEIADALERGVHHIVCLKARQLGITSILLALDVFWLYIHPGLQGAFVCDTESNRENFRQQITNMMASLPRGFQIPITKHDRTMLVLKNDSTLQYLSAGKTKNTGLGRSRALNYVHASELGQWGDPKGYDTLMDTLAQENPNRLYIFESTAMGFNLFYDCWTDASEDKVAKATCFIGWWSKDIYRFPSKSPEFEQWWGAYPAYSEYEAYTTKLVYDQFDWEIIPEQWAWYRWKANNRSEQSMMEEFPSTPDESFQETGSPYFNGKRLTTDYRFLVENHVTYEGYTYGFGDNFLKTKLRRSITEDEIYLRVWERPQPDGKYVFGVDPAYGSSEEADRTVISIWRCFSDKLVQVAEYVNSMTNTSNCAWALAHLAGEYRDCMINIELQGGGADVMSEINYLRKSVSYGPLQSVARDMNVEHILDSARWFLYRRVDSMNGNPQAYNSRTTQETKLYRLNRMNDSYSSNQLIVRSLGLLEEMRTLKRSGDKIQAGGRAKDDRVMAAGLAIETWKEWIQGTMMNDNRSWEREMKTQMDRQASGIGVLSSIVPQFLAEQRERRQSLESDSLIDRPFEA